jgi:hypothetical protein
MIILEKNTPSLISWEARFKEDFSLITDRAKESLRHFIAALFDSLY